MKKLENLARTYNAKNENSVINFKYGLTERERNVLEFAAHGMDNKKIAKYLFISSHTVKAHIASALKKLSAANRTEAVYTAVKEHIID
jgi:DNA-binding NarL/FixJ family response regulator